jgi:hypothetical protein
VNINAASVNINPNINVSTSVNLGGLRSKSAGVPITESAGFIGLGGAVPLPDPNGGPNSSQRLPPMMNSDGNPISLASHPVRFIQSAPAVSRSINLPPLGGGGAVGITSGAIGSNGGGIADGTPPLHPLTLYSMTPTIRGSMNRLSSLAGNRLRPLETQEEGSEHGSERSTGTGTGTGTGSAHAASGKGGYGSDSDS